ncbi:MAG: class I SAM-dependent methyltransferase [Desulfobacterales bacterium]|nr:class I SAM-dependent methyltransferase [Desulfobacterales bacterium]
MEKKAEIHDEWHSAFLKYFDNKKHKYKRDSSVIRRLGILNQKKELQILELFCGKGECQELLINNGYVNVFGSDISETLVTKTRKDCRVIVCNSLILSFKSNIFDLVLVNEGLHHLKGEDEFRLCFSEIKRVLKNNGSFVFYEPSNTIFRKMASLMIFSPLSNISQKTKSLRKIMTDEMSEYMYWLRNVPQILKLLEKIGFKVERNDSTFVHMAVISRLKK